MNQARTLQAFLRASAQRGRIVLRVAPFTVTIDAGDALRFVNYAIPDDDAQPDAAAVAALREAFRAHERRPRLEWVEEAAPAVAPVLEASGMELELRTPLMACVAEDLVAPERSVHGLRVTDAGDDDLRDTATVQWVAFGDGPPPADQPPPDPRRRGGGAVLARVDGVPAAAA